MSNISCLWGFIPMIITGIAEILVNPVTYQFAFAEAPHQLISVSQSFNLVVAGAISNCVTGPISNLLVKDNLNSPDFAPGGFYGGGGEHCNINWYFLFNIAIAVVCLFLYLAVEKFDDVPAEDLDLTGRNEEGASLVQSLVESQTGRQ